MEERVTFPSDGLKLSGIVRVPSDLRPGERRPAFLVLHGFGGNKDNTGQIAVAKLFADWGYVTMRFDFRGCGESEGEHGRILCLDQVTDTSNAVTYLAGRAEVDPGRIAVVGSSFGAAVAVYTAGVDARVAAVISSGGWGDGERKFRGQHPTPEAWARFTKMLEEGRRYRERTGKSLMVPRYDIVPIPERLRGNLNAQSIMEFPAETAQSMYDFRADDVVGKIAPRPVLLLHSANDSVTPTYESIELFKRANQPAELHLLSEVDHFMFAEDNTRVIRLIRDWLDRYFPVRARAGT
ncbi:MAG: alpha/beta hydrolase [Deltaproteobacteria bacterium]|nr:alpha/beta hydrolase [Deltaproteobacteria bacterium]